MNGARPTKVTPRSCAPSSGPCQRAFEHFEELGLIGGCIYVGDRLAAFTYGSAVNDHTFDTHVEKADTEFDGAFTIINKLFAQHLPERFTLINREEDLGLDGLRQAKLSYHPAFLQHKFAAICMHPDEVACKELWMKAFGDDEQFADSFIMRYYSRRRMLTAEAEGRMAAMLHLLPFRTELGRTTYIYGVATDPAFRGRGLASQLMREAMRLIAERGDDAALLIPTPGKEWLREFYGRFGFAGDVPARFVSADRFDFGTATRPPTGRWSGGATPRFRSPNSSPPPGIHSPGTLLRESLFFACAGIRPTLLLPTQGRQPAPNGRNRFRQHLRFRPALVFATPFSARPSPKKQPSDSFVS